MVETEAIWEQEDNFFKPFNYYSVYIHGGTKTAAVFVYRDPL